MGCSRSACCDGWIVGPSLPCQRDRKLKKWLCCACGPYSDFWCHYKSRGQLTERAGDQSKQSEQCLASLPLSASDFSLQPLYVMFTSVSVNSANVPENEGLYRLSQRLQAGFSLTPQIRSRVTTMTNTYRVFWKSTTGLFERKSPSKFYFWRQHCDVVRSAPTDDAPVSPQNVG